MSKKNHRKTTEIPQVGNALEVPNYVIPTTDLEYREINNQVDPRKIEGEDRECENCKH